MAKSQIINLFVSTCLVQSTYSEREREAYRRQRSFELRNTTKGAPSWTKAWRMHPKNSQFSPGWSVLTAGANSFQTKPYGSRKIPI
jgi:hypothetical protein